MAVDTGIRRQAVDSAREVDSASAHAKEIT